MHDKTLLHQGIQHLIEHIPWILFSSAIILLAMTILLNAYGGVYITENRVSVYVYNPYSGDTGYFLLASFTLLLVSWIMLDKLSREGLVAVAVYIATSAIALYVNPYILSIPIASLILVHLVHVYRGRGRARQAVKGFIASVMLFEAPALLYRLSVLAGLEPTILKPLVYYERVLWSTLWIAAPLSITLAFIDYARKSVSNKTLGNYTLRSTTAAKRLREELYIVAGLVLAFAIGYLGYLPTVNPVKAPLNVDWVYYYNWLEKLINAENPVATSLVVAGDRPFYVVFLYTLLLVLRIDPWVLSVYHNILLFEIYTLASYFMAREVLGRQVAKYAALLAPATPHIASFLYGGFQANLLTVSLVYVLIGLIAGRGKSRGRLVAAILLSSAVAGMHVWTWIQFSLLTLLYIAISITLHIVKRSNKLGIGDLRSTLSIPVVCLAAGAITYSILRLYPDNQRIAGFESSIGRLGATILAEALNPAKMHDNIQFYHVVYTGGSLNNPFYWILYVLGATTLNPGYALLAYTVAPALLALAMYSYNPVFAYRVELNTPTHLIVAWCISSLTRTERILVLLSLYSISLGKILSFIPTT